MPQYFSPVVDRYLLSWLRPETWDSGHWLDLGRFNRFLKSMVRYSRSKCWLHGIRDTILRAATDIHPELDAGYVAQKVERFADRAEIIYHYESPPEGYHFPNHLLEMTNPHKVRAELSRTVVDVHGQERPTFTPQQAEKILADNFGADWEKRWRNGRPRKIGGISRSK